ncbi:MAG: endolytic transglycosylase MltG [Xanthomonadales bacterium]|nr:endolytic transglycosylase MltG [Xanthomonadales bacterium]
MNRVVYAVLALVLAVALAGAAAWQRYTAFLDTPLPIPPEGAVFVLEPGSSGAGIVADLAAAGLTEPGWKWRLLMRLEPRLYRAGEYRLEAGSRPRDVLALLASGRVIRYRVTLVEGWTFRQVAALLDANGVLQHRFDLSDPAAWPGVLEELGLAHPEGWFLPETYLFVRGDSDLDLLRRAHEAMRETLDAAWAARRVGLPLESPYELLILASIIEKETAVASEREEIAGVFVRRLERGMRLQTDPTVIYGIGETFDGDIRRRDLETDTPYNTYTRHGLPPTPIAMPGRASLMAAAQPADGDTLYFVADGNGGHTFSVTLEEHQAAVRKLINQP